VSVKRAGIALKSAAICFEVAALAAAAAAVALDDGILRTSAAAFVCGYVMQSATHSIGEWWRL
jgi:hypothetical protein